MYVRVPSLALGHHFLPHVGERKPETEAWTSDVSGPTRRVHFPTCSQSVTGVWRAVTGAVCGSAAEGQGPAATRPPGVMDWTAVEQLLALR